MKGRTQSDITTYPPRIILTLRQLNPTSDAILECRININGIREFPYVNLFVSPPPAIPLSRSHSEGNRLHKWRNGVLQHHTSCNNIVSAGSDHSSSTGSEHKAEENELRK